MTSAGTPPTGTPSTHDRWEDAIIAALDGRGTPEQMTELERHLEECAACRASREAYGAVLSGLRALRPDALRPAEGEAAGAAPVALGTAARWGGERARWGWVAGGLVAAGTAILVLIGLYLELPRAGDAPQAFTTASLQRATPRSSVDENGPATGVAAGNGGSVAGGPADLTVAREAADPLADLADLEGILGSMPPPDAEEILRTLEART